MTQYGKELSSHSKVYIIYFKRIIYLHQRKKERKQPPKINYSNDQENCKDKISGDRWMKMQEN